jgi:hypothetical protein
MGVRQNTVYILVGTLPVEIFCLSLTVNTGTGSELQAERFVAS